MSGLLYTVGGFHAQGSEIHGKGVSEEQTTVGKVVTANGTTDTPANIIVKVSQVLAAGKSAHGLSH